MGILIDVSTIYGSPSWYPKHVEISQRHAEWEIYDPSVTLKLSSSPVIARHSYSCGFFIRWGKLVPALKCFSDSVVAVSHTLTGEMEGQKMNNKRKRVGFISVFWSHALSWQKPVREEEKVVFLPLNKQRGDMPSFVISLFCGTFHENVTLCVPLLFSPICCCCEN